MKHDAGKNLPVPAKTAKLNQTSRQLAIRRSEATSADYVLHLGLREVKALATAAALNRHASVTGCSSNCCLTAVSGAPRRSH